MCENVDEGGSCSLKKVSKKGNAKQDRTEVISTEFFF